MQSFNVVFFSLLFTAITCRGPVTLSKEQQSKLSDHFVKFGADCLVMHPVSLEDLKALQAYKVPQGKDAACFFGCVLKNIDMIDENGKLLPEKVKELAKKVFDNEDEQNVILTAFQGCAYVNDLDTTDGEKGCDRAKFVLSCLMDGTRKDATSKASERLSTPNEDSKIDTSFSLRQIVQGIIQSFIKLACLGISKKFIPGQILHKILPGLDTISTLCSFVE